MSERTQVKLEYPWADRKIPVVIHYDDNTKEGALEFACCQNPKCGCKVIGNGTLPFPLTISFCKKHSR